MKKNSLKIDVFKEKHGYFDQNFFKKIPKILKFLARIANSINYFFAKFYSSISFIGNFMREKAGAISVNKRTNPLSLIVI